MPVFVTEGDDPAYAFGATENHFLEVAINSIFECTNRKKGSLNFPVDGYIIERIVHSKIALTWIGAWESLLEMDPEAHWPPRADIAGYILLLKPLYPDRIPTSSVEVFERLLTGRATAELRQLLNVPHLYKAVANRTHAFTWVCSGSRELGTDVAQRRDFNFSR